MVSDPKQDTNLGQRPEMASLQQRMQEKVLQVRRPDDEAPRPYDQELVPATSQETVSTGIKWHAYDGPFHLLPNPTAFTPAASGQEPLHRPRTANNNKAAALTFDLYS